MSDTDQPTVVIYRCTNRECAEHDVAKPSTIDWRPETVNCGACFHECEAIEPS